MLSQPENLPSVVRRMTAGQMLLDGATLDQVAKQLNLSMATVKRYRAIIDVGGLRPSYLGPPESLLVSGK